MNLFGGFSVGSEMGQSVRSVNKGSSNLDLCSWIQLIFFDFDCVIDLLLLRNMHAS